jgi:hypothetical protein
MTRHTDPAPVTAGQWYAAQLRIATLESIVRDVYAEDSGLPSLNEDLTEEQRAVFREVVPAAD